MKKIKTNGLGLSGFLRKNKKTQIAEIKQLLSLWYWFSLVSLQICCEGECCPLGWPHQAKPWAEGDTYLPSGCPLRSAAAASSGCTEWAAPRLRTAESLSRPGWGRPWCPLCHSSSPWRQVLHSEPPYLRAFEQLYKKPNNREEK